MRRNCSSRAHASPLESMRISILAARRDFFAVRSFGHAKRRASHGPARLLGCTLERAMGSAATQSPAVAIIAAMITPALLIRLALSQLEHESS
jgi:hypothetical protein